MKKTTEFKIQNITQSTKPLADYFDMVQLGLTLEGVGTALDLEEGLAYLDTKTRRAPTHEQ